MPYVPNTPEDYDVDEATDRLLERYTPGSPVELAPRRQLHLVQNASAASTPESRVLPFQPIIRSTKERGAVG